MRHTLILLSFLVGFAAHGSPVLTMGAGIESRITKDVNPDFQDISGFGQLYMSLSMRPWSVLWEIGRASTDDRNGNYRIQDTRYTTMIWARYELWQNWQVRPFVGAGLGYEMDDIDSQFGSAHDSRWGDGGGIVGVGGGVMTTLYKHWNIEGEMRAQKFEMSLGPTYSFLLRSGYTF